MTAYLIIDAGGTFLKSAVLDSFGNVFPESACSVESFSNGSKDKILQAFKNIISQGLEYIIDRKLELKGAGIAFPGPFDFEKATPLMKHKFQTIYGLDLRNYFYDATGIPRDIPVKFIHDANAVLVGEIWKGNAQGFKNAAVVTLGTGLGFAVSQNGKVLCNDIGGPFLSIFKIPYKDGILEDYTAKRGFQKIYHQLNGGVETTELTVADIAVFAEEGEQNALQTFQKVGEILSESLHNIIEEHQIECLLFSGQISKSFRFIQPTLNEGFKNVNCLKHLAVVKSIEHAALLGALKNLLQE